MRRHYAPFLLLVLPVLSGLTACDSSPSEPTGSVPFTTVTTASVPGSAGPQIQTVVRHAADWSRVWSELWGDQAPALPAVDFSRDMVVLVTGTETCVGGAEVEEIVHTGTRVRVRYGDAAPSLCLCVQPNLAFHAVRAPRVTGQAVFEARKTPPLCP